MMENRSVYDMLTVLCISLIDLVLFQNQIKWICYISLALLFWVTRIYEITVFIVQYFCKSG